MITETRYDQGYASIDSSRRVGPNAFGVAAGLGLWGSATIRLQLGWLSAQLKANPRDQFRWGRYDALCDLFVTDENQARTLDESALRDLKGMWWKQD